MAKITEIAVTYGVTKNLGNYESLRLDIKLSATLENGDDIDSEWANLMRQARQKLRDAAETETEILRNF